MYFLLELFRYRSYRKARAARIAKQPTIKLSAVDKALREAYAPAIKAQLRRPYPISESWTADGKRPSLQEQGT